MFSEQRNKNKRERIHFGLPSEFHHKFLPAKYPSVLLKACDVGYTVLLDTSQRLTAKVIGEASQAINNRLVLSTELIM